MATEETAEKREKASPIVAEAEKQEKILNARSSSHRTRPR